MAGTPNKTGRKYFKDILGFYNCRFSDLDNQHIAQYLLVHRNYPGTNGYNLIRNFFKRYAGQSRSIFDLLEQRFQGFFKSLNEFYSYLACMRINNAKIIKMRHLIIDFYCWLLLNDIYNFRIFQYELFLAYISSGIFSNYHSESDIFLLKDALISYHTMQNKIFESGKNIQANFHHFLANRSKKRIYPEKSVLLNDPVIEAILFMSQCTGLKINSILELKYEDIDLVHQILYYHRDFCTVRLKLVFENNLKYLIVNELRGQSQNRYLFFDVLNSETGNRMDYFLNRYYFTLKNARIGDIYFKSILDTIIDKS